MLFSLTRLHGDFDLVPQKTSVGRNTNYKFHGFINMTKIHELIKRLNRRNFYLSNSSFKFCGCLAVRTLWENTQYQLNISIVMPARPKKKHRDMDCEYHYN